ncbi:hypothetical protein [Streptomyces ipomoeae]|uniref:hypothetical protein n=1 Tax=Streptomyces ipomoeae TaxID=103232 RepID=UPI0015F11667|nr:hypothetical protein [Streptomyces ipomoeae]MDX2938541.1 hypothetical protein [Streptomyces ipomoeae]
METWRDHAQRRATVSNRAVGIGFQEGHPGAVALEERGGGGSDAAASVRDECGETGEFGHGMLTGSSGSEVGREPH